MFKSIWEDLQREFRQGNMVTQLVLANVGVFVFIIIARLVLGFSIDGSTLTPYDTLVNWLSFSSDWWEVVTRPWTIISCMFLHEGFGHIFWNMIILYWFGRIVGDLIGDHRILPIYILGGIVAGFIYFLSANFLPYATGTVYALGASGAVMAIAMTAGAVAPDYIVRLILIGDVKIKYIVGVMLLLDLIGIGGNINTGGHFAHLGGAGFGWFFVYQLRNGTDLSEGFNRFFTKVKNLFRGKVGGVEGSKRGTFKSRKSKTKFTVIRGTGSTTSGVSSSDLSHQEKLDAILEKIKKKGYESLSAEEKEFLFDASKQ